MRKNIHPCCEWYTYDPDGKKIRCDNVGKLYKKRGSLGFDLIQYGKIDKGAKSTFRLCPEHYEECKRIASDLVEA